MTAKRGTYVELVIPDFHGNHIDVRAAKACIADTRALAPERIVFLGDGLDCGGTFSAHQRAYTNEMCETLADDARTANWFLDAIQAAAPGVREIDYLEGNHEAHIERFAARTFERFKDAEMFLEKMGPQALLDLKRRGIRYFRRDRFYQGISIQGTIRRGRIYYTHGICANKHATAVHLERFSDNVCHGHTHRAQSVIGRTVRSGAIGAWCPGTLAQLQPLYQHTNPTSHTHGHGVRFVSRTTGAFVFFNVPIHKGRSLLNEVTSMKGKT